MKSSDTLSVVGREVFNSMAAGGWASYSVLLLLIVVDGRKRLFAKKNRWCGPVASIPEEPEMGESMRT